MANDLAILAREIHGVAGDGDPQDQESSSAPISRVTAHEQVHSYIVKSKIVVDSLSQEGKVFIPYSSLQEEEVFLWLAQILF